MSDKKIEQPKKRSRIGLRTLVKVINGYEGKLVYRNTKTEFSFTLSAFGDYDHIEVNELIAMKNMQPWFFKNGWLIVEDKDVVEFVGLDRLISGVMPLEEVEVLFDLPPSELKDALNKIPKQQKESIALKACKLVDSGEIDSIKTIKVIEDTLGLKITEE